MEKLEQKRVKFVEERLASGKGFADLEQVKAVEPSSYPKSTKTSERYSFCCPVVERSTRNAWNSTLIVIVHLR